VLLQLLVAFLGLSAAVSLPWPTVVPDGMLLGLSMLFIGVVFGFIACYAFGVSIATSRSPVVRGWQMSAQSIEDFKGFVRMRIDSAGRLTLFPVVLDQVCRDWEVVGGTEPGTARPVPSKALPRPQLAEDPIIVDRCGL
jgi:hypothetical protein